MSYLLFIYFLIVVILASKFSCMLYFSVGWQLRWLPQLQILRTVSRIRNALPYLPHCNFRALFFSLHGCKFNMAFIPILMELLYYE